MQKSIFILFVLAWVLSSLEAVANSVDERLEALEKSVQELQEQAAIGKIPTDGVAAKYAIRYKIAPDCENIESLSKVWLDRYEFVLKKRIDCADRTYYVVKFPAIQSVGVIDASQAILFEKADR